MQSTILKMNNLAVNQNYCRNICFSSIQCSAIREGRFLKKLMGGTRKKKFFFNNAGVISRPSTLIEKKFIPTHRTRRVEVLNKLFMKHVTDLMASGEIAPQLVGRGIDVSHVCITSDFKHLNVFWHSTDNKSDESTEYVLRKCGGQLQHELSQLRVIGVVPPITFVKNKRLSLVNEVEKRLSSCDYGEAFEPTNRMIKKDEPVLFIKLSPGTKSEILNLNNTNQNKEEETFEVELPVMRQDIFGLNCSIIMKKVKKSLVTKAQNAMQNPSALTTTNIIQGNSFNTINQLTTNERRELFTQFLKQRQIQNKRKSDFRIEKDDCLEVLDYDYSDDNVYLKEDEKDDNFEIDERSLQQWK